MRILLNTLLFFFCMGIFGSNGYGQDSQNQSLSKKERRELKKVQRAQADSILFEKAKHALEIDSWVLEGNILFGKYGRSFQLTPNINFVSMEDENVFLQLSSPYIVAGPNGIGGITLKGYPNKKEIKEDKNGNISLIMAVMGNALNVDIIMRLPKNSNTAEIELSGLTNSNRIRISGTLVNTKESSFYRSGFDF